MESTALPFLIETVDPRFVRDVIASIDPRLMAVLERLDVRDRVVGLYAEVELAELDPDYVRTLPLSEHDIVTLARIAASESTEEVAEAA